MAFSPDGTKFATASWDKTARLGMRETGPPLGEPMMHLVDSMTFTPTARRLQRQAWTRQLVSGTRRRADHSASR